MEELMKISYESGQPTVSARELHEGLDIKTPYTMWFERMAEYGFTDGKDFFTKMLESTGGRPSVDHAMTVDMAKQICMIQRIPPVSFGFRKSMEYTGTGLRPGVKDGRSDNQPATERYHPNEAERNICRCRHGESYINPRGRYGKAVKAEWCRYGRPAALYMAPR